jgi:hypothetical protein
MRNKAMWIVVLAVLGMITVVMYAPKLFGDGSSSRSSGGGTTRPGSVSRSSGKSTVREIPGTVIRPDGTVEEVKIPEGENPIKYTSGPRSQRPEHLRTTNTAEDVVVAFETLRESDDPVEREVAMLTIARDKEKANKDYLVEMMRDTSQPEGVRANAALGLGNIGALDMTPYLIEAMEDPNCPTLRARAYASLVKLTGRSYGFDPKAPKEYRDDIIAKIRNDTPSDMRYPTD